MKEKLILLWCKLKQKHIKKTQIIEEEKDKVDLSTDDLIDCPVTLRGKPLFYFTQIK